MKKILLDEETKEWLIKTKWSRGFSTAIKSEKILKENGIKIYKCPVCGKENEDYWGNYNGNVTTGGRAAIICSRCRNYLNGLPLIHHGSPSVSRDIEFFCPSDYFIPRHKLCKQKKHQGICEVYAVWIDTEGRVILNIQCRDCGMVNAIKSVIDPSFNYSTKNIFVAKKYRKSRKWFDSLVFNQDI